MILDSWQVEALESTDSEILLNVARQVGKSTVTAHIAVNQAINDPGLILAASPSQRQSGELFRKILGILKSMDPAPEFVIETATQIELDTGARIVALPGTMTTIRGFSAPKLVLIDEAAWVTEELYGTLRPMLAVSGGRLIALSTPWGRRGWWFNAWEYEGADWRRFRVPASECPRISKAWLEKERTRLGPLRFASEFECNFVDTNDSFFPSKLIEAAVSSEVKALWI